MGDNQKGISLPAAPSPQMSMFPTTEPESVPDDEPESQRVFRDPDPGDIYIGGMRLDQYLEEAGESEPLQLREILRQMDWSVLREAYAPTGRAPYGPAAMMGLILYGLMQGKSSLRQLERLARTDVGCMWVTGGIKPEFSVIGRFIRRHRDKLNGEVFEEVTRTVLGEFEEAGSEDLAGDGTTIQAMASRYNTIDTEAVELEESEEGDEEDNDHSGDGSRRQKAVREVRKRAKARQKKGKSKDVQVSPSEPDAYIQRMKDGRVCPAYKPSVFVNRHRVSVSQSVHPSSELQQFDELLDQADRVNKTKTVRRLRLDTLYASGSVLKSCVDREIDLLCPPKESRVNRTNLFSKDEFDYDPHRDVYQCPAGRELEAGYHYKGTENNDEWVRYRGNCKGCELRSECTTSEKGRSVKRYPFDGLKEALREVMEQPKAREEYKKRQGWVEPVFGALRQQQDLRRFRRRDLPNVQAEFSLHAMAHNLRRYIAQKRRDEPSFSGIFIAVIFQMILQFIVALVTYPTFASSELRKTSTRLIIPLRPRPL